MAESSGDLPADADIGESSGPVCALGDPQRRRSRALRLAAVSSLLSKGGTLLIMLLAVPLALEAIGTARYGVFSAVQSILWITWMCDFGIGAGVVRRIADAEATDDRQTQAATISTAFWLILVSACAALVIGAVVLHYVPAWQMFGRDFLIHEAELKSNLRVALGIFTVAVVLTLTERAREGLQQTHVSNAMGAAMNGVVAAALIFAVPRWPSVLTLMLCFYGIGLTFSVLNSALLIRARPWLLPRRGLFRTDLAARLMREGAAFFIAGTVAPVLMREGVKVMVSRSGGPDMVAHYAVLVQLGFFALGLVTMITRPLWAASADAAARGEVIWLKQARNHCLRVFLPLAVTGTIITIWAGPWLLDLWLHRHIDITRLELAAFSASLVLSLWSLIQYTMLAGSGNGRGVGWIYAAETALALLFSWIGLRQASLAGAFGGTALATLLVSAWIMPWLLHRRLHSGRPLQTGSLS